MSISVLTAASLNFDETHEAHGSLNFCSAAKSSPLARLRRVEDAGEILESRLSHHVEDAKHPEAAPLRGEAAHMHLASTRRSSGGKPDAKEVLDCAVFEPSETKPRSRT
jgi:hypothetical protein